MVVIVNYVRLRTGSMPSNFGGQIRPIATSGVMVMDVIIRVRGSCTGNTHSTRPYMSHIWNLATKLGVHNLIT